jgi:hypothetical protein
MADPGGAAMVYTLQGDLDPLDLEIVERALQGLCEGIAASSAPLDLESDEELERALRRELAETVRASGVTDAESLLDLLFERRGEIVWWGSASQPIQFLGLRVNDLPASAITKIEREEVEGQTRLPTRGGN